MRSLLRILVFVLVPGTVAAQSPSSGTGPTAAHDQYRFSLQGGLGTTANWGGGNLQSISFGYSPIRPLTIMIGAERNHIPTQIRRSVSSFGATRGGTMQFVTGELRINLPAGRTSVYGAAGAGVGVSRPNSHPLFAADEERNNFYSVFFGGGISVPVRGNLSVFADARFMVFTERDVLGLLVPVRGGVAWHF